MKDFFIKKRKKKHWNKFGRIKQKKRVKLNKNRFKYSYFESGEKSLKILHPIKWYNIIIFAQIRTKIKFEYK